MKHLSTVLCVKITHTHNVTLTGSIQNTAFWVYLVDKYLHSCKMPSLVQLLGETFLRCGNNQVFGFWSCEKMMHNLGFLN
jgi:hypothetical protein